MSDPIVIVGASHAGVELAFTLRRLGYEGPLRLLDADPELPYQRPPLSKGALLAEASPALVPLRPASAYDRAGIERYGNVQVRRIDRAKRVLELAGGEAIVYDRLALAVGGRARLLPGLPGQPELAPANLLTLRHWHDALQLREGWQPGARLAVIGGGYIGLEVAAAAVQRGLHVTVIEAQPRVLARVATPELSAFYEAKHRSAGVQLLTGTKLAGVETDGANRVVRLQLEGRDALAVDLVVAGIGVQPNVELAAAAGLAVDDGIVVDEFAATSDPRIVAAGDCTNHPNALLGRRLRLESVQNAVEQARVAAASLLDRRTTPYRAVPWFWSDQYDLKLQMVGLSQMGQRSVRRGDPARGGFGIWHLAGERIVAADMVNRPKDYMLARRLIAEGVAVPDRVLADEAADLAAWLPATREEAERAA